MELLSLLPLWYQYLLVGVFGLIIGSFLNVYIYRLHTGRSLQGSSHCLSCGTPLKWYELVPVVSYLVLRGRCRTCSSYIPFRYVLVELLTAALFVLEFYLHGLSLLFMPALLLLALLVVVAVYDLYHLIIPDELVVALAAAGLLLVGLSVDTGWSAQTGQLLLQHIGAALAAAGFYASLWWFSHGRWIGFGDVKLAFPLGLVVGLPAVFSFIVLSFWVGAILSVLYMLIVQGLKRGQPYLSFHFVPLTIKSEVPFAPFLIIAFLIVWWFDLSVLTLFVNLV